MTKPLQHVLFLLVLVLCIPGRAKAQFPYNESFRNPSASGIVFGGAPSAFLTASGSSSAGGTPIDAPGDGYLRLTNAARDQKGFAYSMSNFPSSNGLKVEFEYAIYGGTGADGISFFLFDATASPFTIGGFGGSLGYAQINTTNPASAGVSKGYLAIGLDEFGNFSNPSEGRQGGTTQVPGSVTLRGKGDGAAFTPTNYRFLTSQQTDALGVSLVGDNTRRVTDPTVTGYRKVGIELIPNPAGGYNINVRITRGGNPQVSTLVIDNYYYPDVAPTSLRYGFASSTGDETNFHEIRNVAIDLYNPIPVANNDTQNLCVNTTASVDVTANDNINGSATSINKASVDLDPATAGQQTSFVVAGKGTFTVNNLGIVQFVPVTGFTGNVTANYTFNDNLGSVSNSGVITLNYSTAPTGVNAGTDQLLNITTATGSYILQGNNPAPNTGLWTQVSGPNTAVFANSSQFNTTVSNLTGGVYIFRWTVTSTGGCAVSDDVQIIVNHPPVAVDDAIITPLNTPVQIPVIDNDTDPEGVQTIVKSSLVIKTAPQNGTITVNPTTGVITYTPNSGFSGTDTFTYTIKDANGVESNIATVSVGVNQKPAGVDDAAATTPNTPVVIPVVTNDPGRNGSTVIRNTDPTNGAIVINADNTITYTPNTGFSGKDTFTYRLRNNGAESDPITVTVSVKPSGSTDNATTPVNLPVTIPVKDNDLSKAGTSVVLRTNPANGTATINADGTVVYTPASGYVGKDTFTYILRTADGIESDPITANVTIKPVGSADAVTTPLNVPVTIVVKDNDLSKTSTTVVLNTNPAHGSVVVDAAGNVIYTPTAGYSGVDNFTYTLRTADGISSDPINVVVTIVAPIIPPSITVPGTSGRPQTINIPLAPGSKITIVKQPTHGTLTIDPVTGLPVYTPDPNYSGPDDFTYNITDINGNTSATPGTITINVVLPAKIGLAKSLVAKIKNTDGSYTLTYLFALVNGGDVAIERVSLTDDLATTFAGAQYTITRLNASGILFTNPLFNGNSVKEMLLNTSTIPAKSKQELILQVNVTLGATGGTFNNTAVATGRSASDLTTTTDISTDGVNPDPLVTGDYSPSIPTPAVLIKNELFIPKGFSPNNDGINDLFVIENGSGTQILLEVYNRWGNRIFRSADYKNTWNGKTTEGIYIGDDVPVGTYYYIVVADNNKYVGYITINR
ncbi:MAG: tandem-95 repeat protein [Pedobacter sp.]|nr:MAG: tandem-95 repeat protein [Pedobacter sp.]